MTEQRSREAGHRCKAGEVEMFEAYLGADHLAADPLDRRLPFTVVATGQNDFCTSFRQGQGRLVAETARRPRDNGCLAELRRNFGLCRHGSTLLKRSSHFRKTKRNDLTMPALLSDQRDLQVGGPVLFGIKAADVYIARAPEQLVSSHLDEVVLHEIRSFLHTVGAKRLSED